MFPTQSQVSDPLKRVAVKALNVAVDPVKALNVAVDPVRALNVPSMYFYFSTISSPSPNAVDITA